MINLSKLINGKLLPELRKLGISCPSEACEVHRLATEYHEFTIHTAPVGTMAYTQCTGKRRSSLLKLRHLPAGLHLSAITAIIPATSDSLPELGVDPEEKTLQIEDPELFKLALAIITTRWRAMQRYEDFRILDYIETHSKTERALFGQDHINRLLYLAGQEPNMDIPWIGLPHEKALAYIEQARQRMQPLNPALQPESR